MNITDKQIRELRNQAAAAGNRVLHETCNRALRDTVTAPAGVPATADEARAACARALADDYDHVLIDPPPAPPRPAAENMAREMPLIDPRTSRPYPGEHRGE